MKLFNLIFFLIFEFISICFFQNFSYAQPKANEDLPSEAVSDNWQYRWGDSPIDSKGFYTWTYDDINNSSWKPFNMPGQPPKKNGQKLVWLKVKLPDKKWKDPAIYLLGASQIVEIYFKKNKIFYNGNVSLQDKGLYKGYKRVFLISLPPDYQGEELYCRIYSTYSRIGLDGEVKIGSYKDHILSIFMNKFDQIIIACSMILIGLITLFIYFIKRVENTFLIFGFFTICMGFYSLMMCEVRDIIWDAPILLSYLELGSLFLIPVFLNMFIEKLFGPGFIAIIRRNWQIHLIYAVCALSLSRVGIIHIDTIIPPYMKIVLYSILTSVTWIAINAVRGNIDAKIFSIGMIILAGFDIHDILASQGIITLHRYIGHYGMFLFDISLCLILGRHISEMHNNLKTYSLELHDKNLRLSQLDKLKDEFLANTSHELRTPLNGIIGLAESLVDGARGALNKGIKSDLAMIVSSGKRLSNLVNDILDFAKLKNKDINLRLRPIDIGQLCDIIITLSKPSLTGKQLTIKNDIPANIPFVYGDENRLQQILYNLIGNAIKFTDEGLITITAKHNDEMIMMSVSDTGIGIPKDKLELVFQSFEQVDGSIERKYGGTGLGLSIVKSLIELHGGKVWVESDVSCGSTFYFTIPIAKDNEKFNENLINTEAESIIMQDRLDKDISFTHKIDDENDTNDITETIKIIGDIKGKKILAVDDEHVNLKVIQNNLLIEGVDVFLASSGIGALEVLKKITPDLILLDVMMPKMNGYETAKQIRKNFPKEELPIIFLTAKTQANDLADGFYSGGNDYIAKPFSKKELITRINFHIQLSKSRQNLKLTNMQINHLLDATKDMMKVDKKVTAGITALKHLLSLEGKTDIKQTDFYLIKKTGDSFNGYTILKDNEFIENPMPYDVANERTQFLKNITNISIIGNALIIPVKSEKQLIAYLAIEGFFLFIESTKNVMEGIGRSLALKLENIESEENSRLSSIGSMAAAIVHDLKNPIGAIIGYADMAGDEEISLEVRKEYLDIISKEATRMSNMAHEVLEFSKGELNLVYNEGNPKEYIEDIAKTLSPIFSANSISFEYKNNYDKILYFDLDRIRRVILNLATNASDAMFGAKSKDAKFDLIFEKEKNGILIKASDNGPGIPEHIQTTIFEPFVTHGKSHGTGLGMAIVKKIVEAHKGNINFETQKDCGTTFTIFLPINEDISKKEIIVIKDKFKETAKAIFEKRILIIDDNPIHRQMYMEYLKSWNCFFDQASNAKQGIDKLNKAVLAQTPFDLVIIDKQLPDINGEGIGKIIKEDNQLKNTILIMITGLALRGDVQLIKEIGFAAYLTKPIKNLELLECFNLIFNEKYNDFITREILPVTKKYKTRILIAEDNIVNQKLILRYLDKAGYNADVVENGKQAVNALEKNYYDFVLMDIEMPELNGIDATEIIRDPGRLIQNKQVKIIAMTGHSTKDYIDNFLKIGMNDYITKPIKQEQLIQILEKNY